MKTHRTNCVYLFFKETICFRVANVLPYLFLEIIIGICHQVWFYDYVKVKGFGFRINGTNEHVMIFGNYSLNRRSIPGYIKSRYLWAV